MKKIALLLLLPALLILHTKEAIAQEIRLGIEPTSIQINATPPANVNAPFVIRNLSQNTVNLQAKLIPFEPRENGKIRLFVDEEESLDPIIKERVAILSEDSAIQNIELRPGENRNLSLFMDVNEGDPPGEYYFSLVFLSEGHSLEETNTSSIPGGIATNVMISIGPKGDPSAIIEDFSAPSFLSDGPVGFNLKLRNNGKHLIRPKGNITIKNLLGKEVAKLEILPQYVLSESSRYLIDSKQSSPSADIDSIMGETEANNPIAMWPEEFLMGPYTAEANIVVDAESGKKITSTTRFFALPLQVFAIITGIAFVALGITFRIRAKMNDRKPKS